MGREITDADRDAARVRYPSRSRVRVETAQIQSSAPAGFSMSMENLLVGFAVWVKDDA